MKKWKNVSKERKKRKRMDNWEKKVDKERLNV